MRMHGGLKIYRGSPAAARNYVEADRSRADDYYLAEGTGLAERYVASPAMDDRPPALRAAGTLDGDTYEQWVAGHVVETGEPKGRLRTDAQGVRFVEVAVNGPKTWSLAAALHPEIGEAYDAAQEQGGSRRSSAGSRSTRRRGSVRGVGRSRCRSRRSRRRSCGTTRRGPATRTGTCTCRSTPASGRPVDGAGSTPSGSATAWARSTAWVTPRSCATRTSAPRSPATGTRSIWPVVRSPSWLPTSAPSAPGPLRSGTTSSATKPSGEPTTRTRNPAPSSGRPGTDAPGPRPGPTRSSPKTAPSSRSGGSTNCTDSASRSRGKVSPVDGHAGRSARPGRAGRDGR